MLLLNKKKKEKPNKRGKSEEKVQVRGPKTRLPMGNEVRPYILVFAPHVTQKTTPAICLPPYIIRVEEKMGRVKENNQDMVASRRRSVVNEGCTSRLVVGAGSVWWSVSRRHRFERQETWSTRLPPLRVSCRQILPPVVTWMHWFDSRGRGRSRSVRSRRSWRC